MQQFCQLERFLEENETTRKEDEYQVRGHIKPWYLGLIYKKIC